MSGSENIRQVHSNKEKVRKMKNNVINGQFAIDCHNGSLSIIGIPTYNTSSVVFRLVGDFVGDLMRSQPSFCRNCIFTRDVGSFEEVLIFEYRLRDDLRNPRKLLKSVRNRLVQVGFRNQGEDERESHEMYTMTDRQEHEMFR